MTALREVVAGDGNLCERTSAVLGDPHCDKRNKSSGSPPSSPTSIAIPSYFDGLTEEEVVEILRRLPLKLATQCKSVSKNWLSLISSHHFSTSYLRFHHEPPKFTLINRYYGIIGSGIFRETPSSVVKLRLTPTPTPEGNDPSIEFQFLAASDGWVLCSYPYRSGEIYYVINPLTKHRITLPPIPRTSDKLCRVGFTFSGDDGSNLTSRSSSFRVVRFPPTDMIPDGTGNTMKLDIFSSDAGNWTQSTLSFSSDRSAKRSDVYDCALNYHAIALNGKLHWLHAWFASEVLVYDPYEPEKYLRFRLPEDCAGADRYCFGTCQGQEQGQSLRKHLKYSEWGEGVIRVWELKDYDKVEWCLLHRVHVSEMRSRVFSTSRIRWPPLSTSAVFHPDVMAFHPWDRDLVLCFYYDHYLQYNMRLKTLEVFLEEGKEVKVNSFMTLACFLLELPLWPTPVPLPYSK